MTGEGFNHYMAQSVIGDGMLSGKPCVTAEPDESMAVLSGLAFDCDSDRCADRVQGHDGGAAAYVVFSMCPFGDGHEADGWHLLCAGRVAYVLTRIAEGEMCRCMKTGLSAPYEAFFRDVQALGAR